MNEHLRERLVAALELVDGARGSLDKIATYLEILSKWSGSINLTAVRNQREFVEFHVMDALAVMPHLDPGIKRAVDVGSGAGVPGLIIAMSRPQLHVTSLEPNHKKHAFQNQVKRQLGLANVDILPLRDDRYASSPQFVPAEVAMSRATWDVAEWLQRAQQLITANGLIVAMEGANQHVLPARAERHSYRLGEPGRDEERCRAIICYRPLAIAG